MNTEELPPRLGVVSEIFGRDIEGARRESLVDGNIYTPDPGPVHTNMRDQIPAPVHHGDIHRLLDFLRLLLRRGNDPTRCFQIDHV
jgi:hypothetical protein